MLMSRSSPAGTLACVTGDLLPHLAIDVLAIAVLACGVC
jgi:hypothetical protein